MKKTINQLILEELKKINHKLDIVLMARMKEIEKPIHQIDTDKYIKLEMKDYMTPRYLFDECKKLFPIWMYDESELDKITSQRKGNYTVYFKNVVEADEENKNLSANDIIAKGIETITLEERLLMEIEYFKKTGKHLDVENWTLCAGSRHSGGDVPDVRFGSGLRRVYVSWTPPGFAGPALRARCASFPPTEA